MSDSSLYVIKLTKGELTRLIWAIPIIPRNGNWYQLPKTVKLFLKRIEEERIKYVDLKVQFRKVIPITDVLQGSILYLMDVETVSGNTYALYFLHKSYRDGFFYLYVAKVRISQS